MQWDTEVAQCTLIVKNLSGQRATNVKIADKLVSAHPIYVDPNFAIQNLPANCSEVAGTPREILCDRGDLAQGEQASVIYDTKALEPTDVNNVAFVTSDAIDPNTSNNQVERSLSFIGDAVDLKVVKKAKVKLVVVDPVWKVIYTITATNKGPDTAENVVVTDQVPAEVDKIISLPRL